MLYKYYNIIIIKLYLYCNEFIIKNNSYKFYTHIHYKYSIAMMRNKKIKNKKTLEEYYRIKVDIEY